MSPYPPPMDPTLAMKLLASQLKGKDKVRPFLEEHSDLSIDNPEHTIRLLELAASKSTTAVKRKVTPIEVRELRRKLANADFDMILHSAKTLALCSLPIEPTADRTLVREAVDPNGTKVHVKFSSHDPKVPLPYGNDRALITWLMTLARERGTPKVEFNSAQEYLQTFGITRSGENYRELRAAMERITNVVITYGYESADIDGEYDQGEKLVSRKYLPSQSDHRSESMGLVRLPGMITYFIQFGEQTFKELVTTPVSIPVEILRRYRNNPTCWDLLNFFVASSATIGENEERIYSVPMIAQFMGGKDKNPRKLKMKIDQLASEVGDYLGFSVSGRGKNTIIMLRQLPVELRTPALDTVDARPTLSMPKRAVAVETTIEGEVMPSIPSQIYTHPRRTTKTHPHKP